MIVAMAADRSMLTVLIDDEEFQDVKRGDGLYLAGPLVDQPMSYLVFREPWAPAAFQIPANTAACSKAGEPVEQA